MVLGCGPEGRDRPRRSHFDGGEMLVAVCRAMSMLVKEHQMVKISGALHYGVSDNNIVVLGRKTPDDIIIREWTSREGNVYGGRLVYSFACSFIEH